MKQTTVEGWNSSFPIKIVFYEEFALFPTEQEEADDMQEATLEVESSIEGSSLADDESSGWRCIEF